MIRDKILLCMFFSIFGFDVFPQMKMKVSNDIVEGKYDPPKTLSDQEQYHRLYQTLFHTNFPYLLVDGVEGAETEYYKISPKQSHEIPGVYIRTIEFKNKTGKNVLYKYLFYDSSATFDICALFSLAKQEKISKIVALSNILLHGPEYPKFF